MDLLLSVEGANPLLRQPWELTLGATAAGHVILLAVVVVWALKVLPWARVEAGIAVLLALLVPVLGPIAGLIILARAPRTAPGRPPRPGAA